MGFVIPESPVAAIEEGVWFEYEGSEFLIAYASNPKFMRAKQRLEQPHRRKIEANTIDPVELRGILIKAMAEGLLLDWKGVKDASGETVPFKKDLALKALANDEVFRDFVMENAINIQSFRGVEQEVSGN